MSSNNKDFELSEVFNVRGKVALVTVRSDLRALTIPPCNILPRFLNREVDLGLG